MISHMIMVDPDYRGRYLKLWLLPYPCNVWYSRGYFSAFNVVPPSTVTHCWLQIVSFVKIGLHEQ